MTIKEIRNEMKRRLEFSKNAKTGLESYLKREWESFEELYKHGTVSDFSNDFLGFANGFQTTMCEYDGLHILQTLDLHRISASKKVAKAMMMRWLNI